MSEANALTLNTALHLVPNEARLAVALGVRLEDLQRWLRNEADPPPHVMLAALDIIRRGHR
jgi:hypothetical protein